MRKTKKYSLLAFSVFFNTTAQAELIRCPDWRELVLAHEGVAALREADPTVDFEATLASATAKGITGPMSAAAARSTKTTAAPSMPTPRSVPIALKAQSNATCTHTIGRGDTLTKIALKKLGNANRWPEIKTLNQDTIQNANVLRLGSEIKIPCATAATPPPLQKTTTSTAPPAPNWTAEMGEDLEVVLRRWAKAAKYNFVVDTNNAWSLTTPVKIKGDFRTSVKALIKGLQRSNPVPKIVFFSNQTLELG